MYIYKVEIKGKKGRREEMRVTIRKEEGEAKDKRKGKGRS